MAMNGPNINFKMKTSHSKPWTTYFANAKILNASKRFVMSWGPSPLPSFWTVSWIDCLSR